MHPEAAARRAVGEFGPVADIASGYQAELGVAQGRRTALLILIVLAISARCPDGAVAARLR